MKIPALRLEEFFHAARFPCLNGGKLLSINVRPDESAVERRHNAGQHEPRTRPKKLFKNCKVTICSGIRCYTDTAGAQAPQNSNLF